MASQPFRCDSLVPIPPSFARLPLPAAEQTHVIERQEVPGTTRSTSTGRDCLAATPPGSEHGEPMPGPGFYSGPTPRLQRLTPARPEAGTGDQAGP